MLWRPPGEGTVKGLRAGRRSFAVLSYGAAKALFVTELRVKEHEW